MNGYIKSDTQFYDNGYTYKTKQGQIQQGYNTSYIVYTPTNQQYINNTPVVLVQGWTGVKEDWDELLPYLAVHRPVLVFDNRGMGQSTFDYNDAYTIAQFVDDTYKLVQHVFLNSKKYTHIHLMGISMGGMIACSYAIQHGNHLRTLILGCTHTSAQHGNGVAGGISGDFVAVMSRSMDEIRQDPLKHGTDVQRFQYTDSWIQSHQQKFENIMNSQMQLKRPFKGKNAQFAAIAKYNVRDQLSSIKVPTLIIHGSGDRVIDYKNADYTHNHIQNSELVILENVGHVFWNMDDGQSGTAIDKFINKHDTTHSKL